MLTVTVSVTAASGTPSLTGTVAGATVALAAGTYAGVMWTPTRRVMG